MKTIICFVFVLAGAWALTKEQIDKLEPISKECRELNGISEDTILKVRRGEAVNEPKLKNHVLCVSKKTGLASETGETNVEVLRTKLRKVSENDDEVNSIIQKCVVKKSTPEETAFEIFVCLRKVKPNFSPAN
ncbi:odorant binding protein (subfamily minus-C) C01 [Tribolium castaneum]|uniref:Odorant binding protein (Subfamily minus-C) C01 n=2 Tax=Tribolium castaneum TaxID=7070 RepID=D6WS42_TRICA|nr:PREDICTED: B1 protein [Tribolium castaneum]EFA07544.1 odorant binding protein (subfamily minus-C) C01 [Tribolium castaneum]|eukprot:XP_975687.3 PREDICTED: B1 protein [Tribolium castaneum]